MKNKKRYRLKPRVRWGLKVVKNLSKTALIIIGVITVFNWIFDKPVEKCKYDSALTEPIISEKVEVEEAVNDEEEKTEEVALLDKEEPKPVEVKSMDYRMTYYYTGDETNSGNTTASGKSTKDFQVNEQGWYTYKDKLVVATASTRLLSWDKYKNSTQPTYDLYDELVLTINGLDYDAIVLDVCGACMKDNKIDLFVKDKDSGLDTQIKVRKAN